MDPQMKIEKGYVIYVHRLGDSDLYWDSPRSQPSNRKSKFSIVEITHG